MKTIGISEARRRLPELVEKVARDGSRVDVVRRGKPMVSIVRTEDLESAGTPFKVELACDPDELVDVIRELRARVGRPRRLGSRRK